jgi:hypothetical protein
MLSRFKPPARRAIWFLGSLWAVAIVFVIARAILPA